MVDCQSCNVISVTQGHTAHKYAAYILQFLTFRRYDEQFQINLEIIIYLCFSFHSVHLKRLYKRHHDGSLEAIKNTSDFSLLELEFECISDDQEQERHHIQQSDSR